MDLIFSMLMKKIINNTYITGKIQVENHYGIEREIGISFQAGHIDYTIRLIEDRSIILHIVGEECIRMYFHFDKSSISTIVGLIGVDID